MKLLLKYIKEYIYNIKHNVLYTSLSIIGTAITFIFVYILLHLAFVMNGKGTPFVNQENKIVIEYIPIKNVKHKDVIEPNYIPIFINNIKNIDGYSQHNIQFVNAFANEKLLSTNINYVNDGYWAINKFSFIEGRPFTQQECFDKQPLMVINQSIAKKYYGNGSAIGQKIIFLDNYYTIIGVVEDFSNYFDNEAVSAWAPYTLNKFITDQTRMYTLVLNFPKDIDISVAKQNVKRALEYYFLQQNKEIDGSYIVRSVREVAQDKIGDTLLSKGLYYLIILLLLIPAINLIALNNAFFKEREEEVAIKRAIGASRKFIWFDLTITGLITSFIGMIVGVVLTMPTTRVIEQLLLSGSLGGDTILFTELDIKIIYLGIIPLFIIFSLISVGIPAYFSSNKNISKILKGDIND